MLYNDAYRPILGATKHPRALGQAGRQCWPEIWHIIGPMLEGVLTSGQATWSEDQLLLLDRNGFLEECYFTFSYSPIQDANSIGGVFTAVTETTGRLVSERRMRTLVDLSTVLSSVETDDQICAATMDILAHNRLDIPFAAIYLLDSDGMSARLAGQTGLSAQPPETLAWLETLMLHTPAGDSWLSTPMPAAGRYQPDHLLHQALDLSPGAPGILPISDMMVLPVGAPDSHMGFLVVGISPYRMLDEDYRGFLTLVSVQVASALATARALKEERKRAEALLELDRAKTEFFSNISHEFRTPITLMLGPVQDSLREEGGSLSASNRERLELVHRNGLRLLKLVNTLLDFSRIEAGRMRATYQPVDLAALTSELASIFRSAIEQANLRLEVDCPPLPEPIYVDPQMWEKIVLNLLSNAFKFTFEGQITVSLKWRGSAAELCVADTGTGIAPQEIEHIFERFHRVTGARSRSVEGSGIGLALVQELVWLHGGSVSVTSVLEKGSEFRVSLPTGFAHLPADQIRADRQEYAAPRDAYSYIEEARRWFASEPGRVNEFELVVEDSQVLRDDRAPLSVTPPPARILLADDNADMRDYLKRLLSSRWAVDTAGDGLSALRAIQANPPDLVVSDVMMPGIDGFDLLRRVREDPNTRDLPMILVSARAGEEARVEGLEFGADDYLVKPFTAREMLVRVESRLELARMRSESQRKITGILESITDAFWAIDQRWCITYANSAAARALDADPAGLQGVDLQLYLQSNLEEENWRTLQQAMEERRPAAFEQYLSSRQAWYAFRAYPYDSGLSIYSANITDEKTAADMLRQIELHHRLLENREKERQEIARDIHDGPIQTLVSTIFNAQFAKDVVQEPVAKLELEQIGLSLKGAVRELREVVNELRPPALIRFGLAKAIRVHLVDFQEKYPEIEVGAELEEDDNLLSEPVCLALYRIFQEAMNNIIRHSGATQIKVRLKLPEEELLFEIEDNGKGFINNDPNGLTLDGHYGLAGMKERADTIHGEFQVTSAPNQGTRIALRVPWTSAARKAAAPAD